MSIIQDQIFVDMNGNELKKGDKVIFVEENHLEKGWIESMTFAYVNIKYMVIKNWIPHVTSQGYHDAIPVYKYAFKKIRRTYSNAYWRVIGMDWQDDSTTEWRLEDNGKVTIFNEGKETIVNNEEQKIQPKSKTIKKKR